MKTLDEMPDEDALYGEPPMGHSERPWGWFLTVADRESEPIAAVKVIVVMPGERMSLQRHAQRAEIWMPLGRGLHARIGEKAGPMEPGQRYVVPRGTMHRMGNRGDHPVRLVEVMLGVYDEDDCERLADDYGRS